jgi:Ferredoxin thioredoxin reductase variable alpha chain
MKVGDRVQVVEDITVYHIPGGKGQPVKIKGYEGSIDKIVTEWKGRPVSANFPVLVKFDNPKFRAHLQEHELKIV